MSDLAFESGDSSGLGRLERVDPRSVWVHEARDLTPWVKETSTC